MHESDGETALENATERDPKNSSFAELNASEFAKFRVDILDDWPRRSLDASDDRAGTTDDGKAIELLKMPESLNGQLDAIDDLARFPKDALDTAGESATATDALSKPDCSNAADDTSRALGKMEVHIKKSLLIAPPDASSPLEALPAADNARRLSNTSERGNV
jgi:hypothetical protein